MRETRCKIGAIEIARVTEQVGPGFAPNFLYPDWDPAVVETYRDWMVPTCFDEGQGLFIASLHTWVVRIGGKVVLIDGCAGNDKHRPQIPRFHQQRTPYLARLAEAGVTPDQVDFVLCTHLHADHCGWNTRLVDGRWTPTFPNARYVFSRAELDHWSVPGGRDELSAQVYQDSVLPVVVAGLAEVVDGEGVIAGGLHLRATPGHSPGHLAVALSSEGRAGLFTGDIMHQPIQVYRPSWNSVFCEDAEAARRSRLWALETAVETDAVLFSAHFAGPSAGSVRRRGDRFSWAFIGE